MENENEVVLEPQEEIAIEEEVEINEQPQHERKVETDEARLARITRQKAQLEKKLGLNPEPKIINEASKTYGVEDEVLDLRLEGYSKSDVEFIMKNGGRKALGDKNSLTFIAISQKRQQEKAENAASQVTDSSSKSDIEKKYSQEQLRNMSVKDLEALLPKAPNQ
jgi:hypothetical protein